MQLFKYLFSKKFIVHAIIAAILFSAAIWGVLKYLDHYTLHGTEIEVPSFKGLTETELQTAVDSASLRYLVLDSIYLENLPKGTVISQDPYPGDKVKPNRTIYVTVNRMEPPKIPVPRLVDKSLKLAAMVLENMGLHQGELIYKPNNCVDCVLEQQIDGKVVPEDSMVLKGTKIDLVLGAGLSDEVRLVPLLLNLTLDEARAKLTDYSLNLGIFLYDESVLDQIDSNNARIFKQSPQYSEKSLVRLGSSVDVELTIDLDKVDTTIVPLIDTTYVPVDSTDSIP